MKLRLIMCLSLLVLLISPVFASDGIFTDALYSEAAPFVKTAGPDLDSTIIRSRVVRVDFDRFAIDRNAKIDEKIFMINLFDDAFFTAFQEKVIDNASGSTTWIGKLTEDDGRVILTLKDKIMVGSVSRGNENYVIRYIGGGIHEIRQTDHSRYPGCEEPTTANEIPGHDDHDHIAQTMADDGSVIDIMVVYNADARSAAGGTTAMENLIDQAVAESNTGYSNSQVNLALNLVHTMEVTYSETGFNWSTCLNRLANPSDGYMDEVHPARDNYNADMVQLVVNNQSYCGLAYTIMADESEAFSLASRVCITGYYSFAHEFGHLQGARHDRYVDNTDYSPYTYNHGWTNPPDQWRTIMAYNNACSAYGGCTRINYWSNPGLTYGGDPMGDPGGAGVGADNHRCLNNTAYTVANFRQSGSASPPVADFSGTPTTVEQGSTVAFTDLSSNGPTSWSWTFSGGTPSSSTAQNPTVTYNTLGTYNVSLTATNAAGSDGETKNGYITVIEVQPDPEIFVQDITQVINRAGKNYTSIATVTIMDTDSAPVSGASVSITWSGVVSGSQTLTTDSQGKVSFTSAKLKSTGPFIITVNNVTHATLTYNSSLNVETSDSATY